MVDDARSCSGAVEVAPHYRIVPPWQERDPLAPRGETVIVLSPGPGFGRGDHDSTALCLLALGYLARTGFSPRSVLDFGSGSGVLSIAAALLGARVEAVDISPEANAHARENTRINGVDGLVSIRAALSEPPRCFDIVLANILSRVLLEHAAALAARQSRSGHLVLSGLVATDVPAILACYSPLLEAMKPEIYARGEWRAIVYSPTRPLDRACSEAGKPSPSIKPRSAAMPKSVSILALDSRSRR